MSRENRRRVVDGSGWEVPRGPEQDRSLRGVRPSRIVRNGFGNPVVAAGAEVYLDDRRVDWEAQQSWPRFVRRRILGCAVGIMADRAGLRQQGSGPQFFIDRVYSPRRQGALRL